MPTIQLTHGQVALVDECDFYDLRRHKWHARWSPKTKSFYAGRTIVVKGRDATELMHRRILGLSHGDGLDGHHENHDTLDNRRSNIEIVTPREHCEKRRDRLDQSVYGRGIYKHKDGRRRPFEARAWLDSRNHHIGHYATAEEARSAREAFVQEIAHGKV